jgi:hypothetical protein
MLLRTLNKNPELRSNSIIIVNYCFSFSNISHWFSLGKAYLDYVFAGYRTPHVVAMKQSER